jgi:outer membrane protein TolC
VRSALLSVREARERIDVEQRALTVAEEQARVARLAYREGLITSVEGQDAELALTAARFALLRARHDGALAEARLTLAMGL